MNERSYVEFFGTRSAIQKAARRATVAAILVVLVVCEALASAEQGGNIPRIGVLSGGSAGDPRLKFGLDVLRQGLRDIGYVEGKTINFEYRFAERQFDRLPKLAAELVRLKVNILFGMDSASTSAAKQATSTIPIIFTIGGDPIGTQIAASLARPVGNATGITTDSPRLVEKRLGLLKETVPKLSRIGFLLPSDSVNIRAHFNEAQPTAKTLGVTFQAVEVAASNADFDSLFQVMVKERIDGLVTEGPPIISSNRKKILQLAAEHRLPAIHTEEQWAKDGGLMSYGASRIEPYRRAVVFFDKVLKGAKPGDLPIEQPTKFEFVINLRTAKALNLTIPQTVLFRATKVIK